MVQRVQVDGGSIVVEVAGEGPLVVCAHGMGDARQQFRLLAPALQEAGYRVASVDLRGHGESDVGFATYGPEAVGADLLAVVEALGGPAVLVANSAAAASAVWAAAERPDRVRALALLGPVVGGVGGTLPGALQRTLGALLAWPWGRWFWLAFYRSLFKGGAPADQDAHVARLRRILADRRRLRALWDTGTLSKAGCAARTAEVRAPVLSVFGDRDPDYPDLQAEVAWHREHLGARAVVLEGVGHYPHLERPDETRAAILDFLAEGPCRASA